MIISKDLRKGFLIMGVLVIIIGITVFAIPSLITNSGMRNN